jgi:hypothetical protein
MGTRAQAIKNLKKKGADANPNGRPKKGYSITEWFKGMLDSNPEVKDELGSAILQKAKQGDTTAMKLIWNYMDGMPQQDITSGGKPITVSWSDED